MNTRLTERERLFYKLDRLTETEINQVLDYVISIESNQRELATSQSSLFSEFVPSGAEDELVSILGSAYENRRARQVIEWETIRRRAESLASARHYARP